MGIVRLAVQRPYTFVVMAVAALNDRDQVEIKRVTLGRDLGTRVVIVEGISGDERLVVNPGDTLVEGVRIQVGHAPLKTPQVAQR